MTKKEKKNKKNILIYFILFISLIFIYSYYIETNHIECNLLFEYLKRFHKIWCCIDDENNIIWINACKVLKNCVK